MSRSVLHANLYEITEAVELKNMSFNVICGDLPVYSLLRSANEWRAITITHANTRQYLFRHAIVARAILYMKS